VELGFLTNQLNMMICAAMLASIILPMRMADGVLQYLSMSNIPIQLKNVPLWKMIIPQGDVLILPISCFKT
jgi:hypothetical protein